ncbi:hypothetical protein WA158_004757 [Blastocystis sp. Blastoise]
MKRAPVEKPKSKCEIGSNVHEIIMTFLLSCILYNFVLFFVNILVFPVIMSDVPTVTESVPVPAEVEVSAPVETPAVVEVPETAEVAPEATEVAPETTEVVAEAADASKKQHRNRVTYKKEDLLALSDEELQKIVDTPYPKYNKPVKEDLARAQKKIDDQIADLRKKSDDLQKDVEAILTERKSKKEGRYATIADLSSLRAKFSEALKTKKSLFDTVNAKKAKLTQLDALDKAQREKSTLKPEAIEERISDLEFKLSTESVNLNEEKNINKKISELRKQLNEASKFKDVRGDIQKIRDEMKELYTKINETKATLDELSANMKSLQDILDASKTNEEDPVKAIYAKKDEIKKEVDNKYAEKKQAFEEFKKNEELYYGNIGNIYKQRDAKHILEDRQYEREQQAKQAAVEAELAKLPPFEKEINVCDRLLTYCKAYIGENTHANEAKKTSETKEDKSKEEKAKDLKLFKKQDEDFFGSVTKVKKAKKTVASTKKVVLQHTFETLDMFNSIQVPIPTKKEDLKQTVEQIEKRKDLFVNLPRGSDVKEALAKQEL